MARNRWMGKMNIEKLAKEFALEKHGDQMYGDHPYSLHLREVVGAIYIFRPGPYMYEHAAISWLHDVLEDTDATEEEMYKMFGGSITDAVIALTNDGEPFHKYLAKIKHNRSAVVVKMCDRLANMDNLRTKPYDGQMAKLVNKYVDQYPEFKAALYSSVDSGFWKHVDRAHHLLTEKVTNG